MKKIFTAEELSELLDHVSAISELTHQSNTKTAKDMKLPDGFISYMESKTLNAPEDLKCDCPECNPKGVETR